MKRFFRPPAAGAAVVASVFVCVALTGQTMVDMRSQAKNIDFSRAASTHPFTVGTVLPAACTTGQTFFRADAQPGHNLYLCTAPNAWAVVEGTEPPRSGSSGSIRVTTAEDDTYELDVDPAVVSTQSGNNAYAGHNDFGSASSLRVVVSSSKPAPADCDSAAEVGRMVLYKSDPALNASRLYLCQATGTSAFGWKVSSYSYGSGLPAYCDAGELFFDVSAAAGQNWWGCVSTDLWRILGGGGSSLPSQASQAGRILGTDGTAAAWRGISGFTDDGSMLLPDGTVLAELAGNNLWTGHQYYPASEVQPLAEATSAISCNQRTVAISAAAPLTLSSAATIPDGSDGQVCVVVNTGSAGITLQDQDTLPDSNLQLTAARVTIPPKGQITLQFSGPAGEWIQDGVAGSAAAPMSLAGANGVVVTNETGESVVSIPGTSKGDLIVHNGTTNTRLASGADGQSLIADSSQPSGMKWTARSVAGQNGVAVNNGDWSSGGTATITLPGTSKGDLMVHDGTTNTRLATGSDGQSLVADSSQSSGMKWAARSVTGENGVTVSNGNWSGGEAATIALPGTSKGDLIVHNGTTNTRLPGGSDGQSLVADSSQASGMKWTARSVAGQNGVAVNNGDWSSGGTATITLPGTSKGDLMVHDGTTNTRLASGSDGQTLVADSSQPSGMKWAARSVTGENGVTVSNGNWSSGGTATITLPGASKGDLIVHNGTSNTRLPGGSDGQSLVADSSQPSGMKWATATISLPGTTKGDLVVHDGTTNTRLASGANGQTLVADSSEPAGLKWATPTAALPGTTKGDLVVHDGTTNTRLSAGAAGQTLEADPSQPTGLKYAVPTAARYGQTIAGPVTATATSNVVFTKTYPANTFSVGDRLSCDITTVKNSGGTAHESAIIIRPAINGALAGVAIQTDSMARGHNGTIDFWFDETNQITVQYRVFSTAASFLSTAQSSVAVDTSSPMTLDLRGYLPTAGTDDSFKAFVSCVLYSRGL